MNEGLEKTINWYKNNFALMTPEEAENDNQ